MGGWRCSYRNCKQRSDGKTHMFHYPVFDKVRCHQWLTNAQKLEFLNLKVSQLKNRVVCQHHFTNDNFMNYMKDKLTFEAVPTENGPYCDSSQLDALKHEPDHADYNISLEDIENDYLTLRDKKEKFSVKYGDFLTNCDFMDLTTLNPGNTKKEKDPDQPTYIINNHYFTPNILAIEYGEINLNPQNEIPHNQEKEDCVKKDNCLNRQNEKLNTISFSKDNKITILSHKKITEPAKIPLPSSVDLQPVSPSRPLPLPTSRRFTRSNVAQKQSVNIENMSTENKLGNSETIQQPTDLLQVTDISSIPIIIRNEVENKNKEVSNNNIIENNVTEETSTQLQERPITRKIQRNKTKTSDKSIIKKTPCMSPEKMAAIQEKRKFNMKLRDIIETCLDKIDDQEKVEANTTNVPSLGNYHIEKNEASKCEEDPNVSMIVPPKPKYGGEKSKSRGNTYCEKEKKKRNIENEQVASYLSRGSDMPNMQEYAISYLEARIKKMEDTLIKKVDQNSKSIMDLKRSFSSDKNTTRDVSTQTQTVLNEEVRKKQLYQEISKFLTPDANSLIYEELFINKFACSAKQNSPKTKRRKYR